MSEKDITIYNTDGNPVRLLDLCDESSVLIVSPFLAVHPALFVYPQTGEKYVSEWFYSITHIPSGLFIDSRPLYIALKIAVQLKELPGLERKEVGQEAIVQIMAIIKDSISDDDIFPSDALIDAWLMSGGER